MDLSRVCSETQVNNNNYLQRKSDRLLDLFKETLRTGITPAGRELDQELMPARVLGNMTDEDMEALHAFFGTL